MKRGFTFVELIFASSISVFVFAAIFVGFSAIWQLMKVSSEELQLAIHARMVREQLLVRVDPDHDGLLGVNANLVGKPSESTGFNVKIARYERKSDGTVEQDQFAIPDGLKFLYGTKSSDVGMTGNVVDKVYDYEFLPSKWQTGVTVPKLLRMNLYHRYTKGTLSMVMEDHPVFYMENGAW